MTSCRQIATPSFYFSIYGQFAAIWRPDSGRMVYKTYIFINNNFLLTEPENSTKNL